MKNVFSLMRMDSRFGGEQTPFILAAGALLFSICTLDRAFITGYACAIMICLYLHPAVRRRKRLLWIAALLLLLLPIALAFCLKTGSSQGRLLIYKISANILREHFPQGIGWGKFQTVYNNYQAAYFRDGNYTTTELLVADNSYFAFNDYFQWIIEGGWIAMIAIPALLAALLWLVTSALRQRKSALLIISITQLAAMLVAACFTHVFDRPVYQCLALMAIGIIAGLRWQYAWLPALLALGIHYSHLIFHFQQYRQIKDAKAAMITGNRLALLHTCEALYPHFQQQPEFLALYGARLLEMEDGERAPGILLQAAALRPRNTLFAQLGTAYELAGDITAAESSYLQAVYMVPNRFVTKMQLFSFYERQGRLAAMQKWGRIILAQPVKIPSARVDQILEQVKKKMGE
ncbi:hypothetical protein F0L74_24485 [Chitinophaga agrisoli]|uniref:O-antigen ligase-related domain-containing protein n=1 Tax=Chitinophaga agrisoli TaxID=2607653 RepID=A0A5B2VKM0_9BACT|nr:O-antigen ligase family protein [Chitinophaga agrisoli]KAA2239364.1 hypothetical protein F0L74_24485 [Chitinophaga agrisoli]